MFDQPTYIVTGGAGFVGSNLVAALLAREPRPRVVVIDSFRSGSFANLVEACERGSGGAANKDRSAGIFDGEVIAGSSSRIDWERVIGNAEVKAIFHLGAITDTTVSDETEMLRENVVGFAELIRACAWRRIPLVYASSAATYGSPPQARDRVPFPVEAAGRPNNVYGFSKWMMECEHHRLAEDSAQSGSADLPIVGLRYFNVFGPGESRKGKMASMVYQLARQMLEGKRPRIFADGSQARDQVYVDDVVDCTLAAAGMTREGQGKLPVPGVYNLGSGETTSFNGIIAALREGLGISEKDLPTEMFEMPASIRAFYQDYTCADVTKTEQGLNWKPRWKPSEAIVHYATMLRNGG